MHYIRISWTISACTKFISHLRQIINTNKYSIKHFNLKVTYFNLNVTYFNLSVTYFNLRVKRCIKHTKLSSLLINHASQ